MIYVPVFFRIITEDFSLADNRNRTIFSPYKGHFEDLKSTL